MEDKESNDQISQKIISELQIMRQSQPTDAAIQSYRQMFEHVQKQHGNRIGEWLQTVTASLSWDSRQEGLTAGARRVGTPQAGRLNREEYRPVSYTHLTLPTNCCV